MSEKSEKIKETIADVYYDKAGYGSVYSTYKEANAQNKLIKLDAVKDWFQRNILKAVQCYTRAVTVFAFCVRGPSHAITSDFPIE